ncbi:MAG: hypothetical protein ACP5RN_02310 [Armatimonadota bacterium]
MNYDCRKVLPMASTQFPAQTFYVTDVGSRIESNSNAFAGWYIAPGYDNGAPNRRWPKGQRHQNGRNWIFADGHAKYHRAIPPSPTPTARASRRRSSPAITRRWESTPTRRAKPVTSPLHAVRVLGGLPSTFLS